MPDRHDAGGAVHVETRVAAFRDRRLPGMETHAHLDRRPIPLVPQKGKLPFRGGEHGIARVGERKEEAVSLRLHLDPVVSGGGVAKKRPMCLERGDVTLAAETLQQARRALDIREEERYRAAGQVPS